MPDKQTTQNRVYVEALMHDLRVLMDDCPDEWNAGLVHGAIEEIERLCRALQTIRDLPIPEQDNMVSANMRKIARETLECLTL